MTKQNKNVTMVSTGTGLALPVKESIEGVLSTFMNEGVNDTIKSANSITVCSIDDTANIDKSKKMFTELNSVYKAMDSRRAEIKKEYLDVTRMIDGVAKSLRGGLEAAIDHLRDNKNFVENHYKRISDEREVVLVNSNLFEFLTVEQSKTLDILSDADFRSLVKDFKAKKLIKDKANAVATKMYNSGVFDSEDTNSVLTIYELFSSEGVDFGSVKTGASLKKELKKVSSIIIKRNKIKATNKDIFS